MTALPEPVDWTPPGPGLWMRNFRLGEWLPEAMTPLFADWLLPRIEAGYLAGMRTSVGTVVPFRYAVVNGWYYNALPVPSPRLLPEYRRIVDHGEQGVDAAGPTRLIELVDQIGHIAGRYLWYLAIVGGSAWKIEACLTDFVRCHLAGVLEAEPQVLLTGLPGAEPRTAAHAVHSLDWYQPTSAEHGDRLDGLDDDAEDRIAR